MSWWLVLFINGAFLYIGAVLTCAGLLIRCCGTGAKVSILGNVLILLGVLGVAISATPLAWWVYTLWGLTCLGVIILLARPAFKRRTRLVALAVFMLFSIVICGLEGRRAISPELSIPAEVEAFYVVGDSLSMGADALELNWPALLGKRLDLPIHNHSFGGAKVASALSNAKRIGPESALVLFEIGGNDLLKGTPPKIFERDLRALLEAAQAPGRHLMMLELPLPPSFNAYGRIQRRLAQDYEVTLIPKHIFASVFSVPGATVDSLHLSHIGHAALADRLALLFNHK